MQGYHPVKVLAAQSCPTLCDPTDCSPPGSSVHGVFQARILGWVAISSSRGSSQLRDQTHVSCVSCIGGRFFTTVPPGKPRALMFLSCLKYLPKNMWLSADGDRANKIQKCYYARCNSVQFSSVAQLCPTLRDPMNSGPPGSSVHGILQARILEGAAISCPRNKH